MNQTHQSWLAGVSTSRIPDQTLCDEMARGGIPRVSVVMSVYNGGNRLRKSMDSVLQQEGIDFEFIIVNDGSTDSSREILAEYKRRDTRVRVFGQENVGLTRSLIRGCSEARASLIARQDADDWSFPRRLREQATLLETNPQLGFVSCWTQYVGPNDEVLDELTRPSDSREATRRLLDHRLGPPAHGSVLFRSQLYRDVGGYRPEFYCGQDSDLWLRMAERSHIAYVPEVLYRYRVGLDSISSQLGHYQREFGRLGQACRAERRSGQSEEPHLRVADLLTEEIRAGRHRAASARLQMEYLIGTQLAHAGDRRAAPYLWSVIRRCPWHWRAWGQLVRLRLRRGSGARK